MRKAIMLFTALFVMFTTIAMAAGDDLSETGFFEEPRLARVEQGIWEANGIKVLVQHYASGESIYVVLLDGEIEYFWLDDLRNWVTGFIGNRHFIMRYEDADVVIRTYSKEEGFRIWVGSELVKPATSKNPLGLPAQGLWVGPTATMLVQYFADGGSIYMLLREGKIDYFLPHPLDPEWLESPAGESLHFLELMDYYCYLVVVDVNNSPIFDSHDLLLWNKAE